MLHIGKRIKEVVEERKIAVVDFAKALPCSRENVYRIYQRESIDTALLIRIGRVLKYDFFEDIRSCDGFDHM